MKYNIPIPAEFDSSKDGYTWMYAFWDSPYNVKILCKSPKNAL